MEGQVGQAPRAQGLLGGLTCSTGTGTLPQPHAHSFLCILSFHLYRNP